MTSQTISTIDSLRQLPVAERLEVVQSLWESIWREQDQLPVSAEMLDVLDEIVARHDAQPATGCTVEELGRELFPRA